MAKQQSSTVLHFVAWLTGVIVSLAVGFSLISSEAATLTMPTWLGGEIVAMLAGWVVLISTAVGIVMAILKK